MGRASMLSSRIREEVTTSSFNSSGSSWMPAVCTEHPYVLRMIFPSRTKTLQEAAYQAILSLFNFPHGYQQYSVAPQINSRW